MGHDLPVSRSGNGIKNLHKIVCIFDLICSVALFAASLCNFFALDSEGRVIHFKERSASGEEVCNHKEKSNAIEACPGSTDYPLNLARFRPGPASSQDRR